MVIPAKLAKLGLMELLFQRQSSMGVSCINLDVSTYEGLPDTANCSSPVVGRTNTVRSRRVHRVVLSVGS